MLETAFFLAVLTTGAFMALYSKLPLKMRQVMEKHQVLTETIATVGCYALHGGTIIALIASGIVCAFVSLALHVKANPERYQGLYTGFNLLKQYAAEGWDYLMDAINEIAAKQQTKTPELSVVA